MLLRNSIAHLIARIASLSAGIVNIPLVATTLGAEALGLVGLYSAFLATLALLDLGLPTAINHRLATMRGRNELEQQQASLVRAMECMFWLMSAFIFLLGFLARGPISSSWLSANALPPGTIETSLALILGAAAVRFPIAFYSNVLFAFDRHLYPNVVTTFLALTRTAVSLLALVVFEAGIIGFFVIQLTANIAEVASLMYGIWRRNPYWRARPMFVELRSVAVMTGGLTLVSLTAIMLSQIDKVVLSKLLSLADFGIYSAGYTLATGLVALSYPIGNAIFPQLSRSLDLRRSVDVTHLMRAGTELTILIVVPLGCVAVMQAEAILGLLFIVRPFPGELSTILPGMMAGAIAQSFVTLPQLFQIAAGRISIIVWINVVFFVPYVLLILAMVRTGGLSGAATAFAIINAARLLAHWGAMLARSDLRPIWSRSISLVVISLCLAVSVAWITAQIETSASLNIARAIVMIPLLGFAFAILLPVARRRILTQLRRFL